MSHQTSRTLWFWVKGDPIPHDLFDIPIGTRVSRLKAMIKEEIETLHDIDYDTLKLFKLKMMVPISPDNSFLQRLAELGDIDTYLTKLNSTEKVGELFPEPHSKKHLHIVVERPEIVPPSSSRKRSLSATEEDGQAAKRMKIGGNAGEIQTRHIARKMIQAMLDNLDLSEPSTFKDDFLLFCWILGGHAFSIKIGTSDTVDNLKDAIKKKNENTLAGINAGALSLWKLTDTEPLESEDTFAQRISVRGDLEDFAQKLIPSQKMSSVFQQKPPEDRIHILVQPPPPPMTRGPDAWLMELHSKIWRREDLKSQLYRSVKVTVADFHALQDVLRELHPDRDSPDYISNNVLSTKLEFLRSMSTSAPSPAHSNNKQSLVKDDEDVEESNDDDTELSNSLEDDEDTELRLFLPATLEFLDLSSLGLENVSVRLPSPLFVREEYGLIEGLLEEAEGSVVVGGQPGTGKTAFLHHKVVKNMLHGSPFLYQTIDGIVYHVSEKVEKIVSLPFKDSVVAFVDTDMGVMPKPFLYSNLVQIITTSPGGMDRGWMKQKGQVAVLAANLWSPSELFLTGIFLHHDDLTFKRLIESVSYFNCNPRICFDASTCPESLFRIQKQIEFEIRCSKESVRTLLYDTFISEGVSHSIFEISPSDDDRSLYTARINVVSGWALDILLKKCEAGQADAAAQVYLSLANTPDAGLLRGRLLEKKVLDYFNSFKSPHNFTIRSLANPVTMSAWIYPYPVNRVAVKSLKSFTHSLQSAIENKRPLHLVSLDNNFPIVDSILYDQTGVLTCIQITTRNDHPVTVLGLKRIQEWLKCGTPLAKLRPSVSNPWRFIFVVPKDVEPSFKLQDIQGDTSGFWAKRINQYVLGIDENVVLGRAIKTSPKLRTC